MKKRRRLTQDEFVLASLYLRTWNVMLDVLIMQDELGLMEMQRRLDKCYKTLRSIKKKFPDLIYPIVIELPINV